MVGSMFKVIRDYDPPKDTGDEFLPAEKGDILIDCESIDEHWFRGRNMMSEAFGKIPISYTAAFTSNEEDSIHSPYEDIDADFSPKETSALLDSGNTSSLTANPLVDAVDAQRENENTDNAGNLSKYHESNYVDMSSDETINEPCVNKSQTVKLVAEKPSEKRIPPKPRRSFHDHTKASDDGYNSGSHYSGETSESSAPTRFKAKISKQDDAGYEVPHTIFDVIDDPDDEKAETKLMKDKEKKKFLGKFGFKRSEARRRSSHPDESKENYYDPPSDHRDNYFLPDTGCSVIRILLSFIAALGGALGLFLVLYIIVGVHPVLCFALATIVFVSVLFLPSTVIKRGVLCVTMLCLPSLVSSRAKLALLLLLAVMFMCGPILGVADKLAFVTSCQQDLAKAHDTIIRQSSSRNLAVSRRAARSATSYKIHAACQTSFRRVNEFCVKVYQNFENNYCKRSDLYENIEICGMEAYAFCWNETTIDEICTVNTPGLVGATAQTSVKYDTSAAYDLFTILNIKTRKAEKTKCARDIFVYLLPLLLLFVLYEAYSYNRLYLCTKNMDNIYITHQLRELDCERKNRGLTDVIFPLTRIEFHTYLVRSSFPLSKAEKKNIFKWLSILLVALLFTVALVALENRVYELLALTMTSSCKRLFEDEKKSEYRFFIYLLNFILFFIIFIQSHVLRCRTIICEYFYPDMIDIRSKHLYYKILHDRHTFARHVRRRIQLLSEEKRLTRRLSFKSKVNKMLPLKLQQLFSKLTVRRCMICNSVSYRQTIECNDVSCMAHYCYECYVDAGQQCLTCNSTNNDRTVSIAI